MNRLLKYEVSIVGCGRTDAGVHAADYYFHVDLDVTEDELTNLRFKLNSMLPSEIVIHRIIPVSDDAHARFDATSRKYIYSMHFEKDPFITKYSYRYNQSGEPVFENLQQAARLITSFNSFYPFCKSKTDVLNYDCTIEQSEWIRVGNNKLEYHVRANRFLRGMVRLIVGMCINVANGKMHLSDVENALKEQERMKLAWSAPAHGLSLVDISYPYIKALSFE